MILLGWEIGTGRRVEIPETGHLAWFGQTQLSGKTTALEAIAFRGELRAVAFVTKQGEGGFLTGRSIPPYFSEPTNDEEQPLWRWVKSILEAGQQRRMNFEESWIIRACEDPRQAKTLADVHKNIKDLLGGEGDYVEKGRGKKKKREWKYTRKPVTGINAGVYTSLKAYFDIVMPQLARLPYTKKLALGPGLNVMDLREYAMETQALVIRSVMEWVYQHEKGVRVIVPEAQDFVPQGKNSPVKMACETLVRKAGANKNFMWLDSQDMAAVDKIMLRACSIVGIGVQTEGHEIERSLAGLFTPALRPVDIARLKIGEFFVRVPEARVSKVYVQPAWMDSELHAQAIAKGEESVTSARQMLNAFKKRVPPPPQLKQILSQESPADEEDETQRDWSSAGTDVLRSELSLSPSRDSLRDMAVTSDRDTQKAGEAAPYSSRETDEVTNVLEETECGVQPERGEAASVETAHRSVAAGIADGHVGERADSRTVGRVTEPVGAQPSRETDERENEDSPQQILTDPSQANEPAQGKKEPGKHEHQTTANASDTCAEPDADGFEGILENGAFHRTISGTPVFGGREDRRGSEGAMPQAKQTPFEAVRAYFGEPKGPVGTPAFRNAHEEATFVTAVHDLLQDHAPLIEAHDALAARVRQLEGTKVASSLPMSDADHKKFEQASGSNGHGLRFTVPDLDYICKYVFEKARKDPGVLELLTRRPELRVQVERQTIQVNGDTLRGQLALLVKKGFFDVPKNGNTAFNEVQRLGKKVAKPNVYRELDGLAELGFLTKEDGGYQSVPEMKVEIQKS